jgi:predicted transcriptional regulator
MREDALELDARRRIYEFVRDHPGAHVREVMAGLGMPQGQVTYHLQTLEDSGLVASLKETYHKRYFLPGAVPRAQRELATILRARAPRHILLALLDDPGMAHTALAQKVGVRPSTLTYHMKRLEQRGLVDRAVEGNQVRYRVREPAAIAAALATFQQGLLDGAVDRFLAAWDEMHPGHLAGQAPAKPAGELPPAKESEE